MLLLVVVVVVVEKETYRKQIQGYADSFRDVVYRIWLKRL